MMIQNQDQTVSFSIFSPYQRLTCFTTTKKQANLTHSKVSPEVLDSFIKSKRLDPEKLYLMDQVHGVKVKEVDSESPRVFRNTDALVTRKTGIFLGVNTADCVPLYFFDPQANIVAIAHAGWRGTLDRLASRVVIRIQALDGNVNLIRVAIGPHIAGCCYDVSSERARLFKEQFVSDQIVFQNKDQWYVDLGAANLKELLEIGILREHIDAPVACTSCQNDRFFSYRKENQSLSGEMLGVIGIASYEAV